MKITLPFIALCILLLSGSCTIEKRLYQSGFHIVKHKKNYSSSETVQVNESLIENQSENFTPLENKESKHAQQEIKSLANEQNMQQLDLTSTKENVNSDKATFSYPTVLAEDKSLKKSIKEEFKAKNQKEIHKIKKSKKKDDVEFLLLVILAILLPPVAVGLATNWDMRKTVLNIILTLLCVLPGVIHALIVVFEER
jgi:uncharacterized membrane protein YqaE (UPF0057 family)